MDRTININVNGEFVKKDNKNAGVQGEANATKLHITMSADWEQYSKAHHLAGTPWAKKPVAVVLYNSVEDLVAKKDPLVFDTPIPAEPLSLPGWCSFTIEGYKGSGTLCRVHHGDGLPAGEGKRHLQHTQGADAHPGSSSR